MANFESKSQPSIDGMADVPLPTSDDEIDVSESIGDNEKKLLSVFTSEVVPELKDPPKVDTWMSHITPDAVGHTANDTSSTDIPMVAVIMITALSEIAAIFPILIYNLKVKSLQCDYLTYGIVAILLVCILINLAKSLRLHKNVPDSTHDYLSWLKIMMLAVQMTLSLHVTIGLSIDAQLGFSIAMCFIFVYPIMFEAYNVAKCLICVSGPLVAYMIYILVRIIGDSQVLYLRLFPPPTLDKLLNRQTEDELWYLYVLVMVFAVVPCCALSTPVMVLVILHLCKNLSRIRHFLFLLAEMVLLTAVLAVVCTPGIYKANQQTSMFM